MTRCIAFLRAVNVGGRTVRMEALRNALEGLGLAEVQTFIASGNAIFETKSRDGAALEGRIEAQMRKTFGFEVDTFVRTESELAASVAHAAFDAEAVAAARTHVIGFLKTPPAPPVAAALAELQTADDRFQVHGRELYWLSRNLQSEAAFSNAVFERTFKLRTTFRGIGMLRKLLARLAQG